jgi:hypothetical protein
MSSMLYTFHAKTVARNPGHMLLHVGGAGRRENGVTQLPICVTPFCVREEKMN